MSISTAVASINDASSGPPLLELRGINKSFGTVQVLHDVDFRARGGRVTALVGDNGAGKSTLIKGIAGIYTFDSGSYVFDGREVTVTNPKAANALGIEVVYQDLALCDNLDIVHNLFLGRELRKAGVLDETTMEQRASETLKGFSVRTVRSIRQQVASLSGGQRQTVAIARAVLGNSRLVILDEPTAALGVAQTERVLRLVRRLADRGLAVILISHNLNDVFAVADDIAVLYLGQLAATVNREDVTQNQVVELITAGRIGAADLGARIAVDDGVGGPVGHPRVDSPVGRVLGVATGDLHQCLQLREPDSPGLRCDRDRDGSGSLCCCWLRASTRSLVARRPRPVGSYAVADAGRGRPAVRRRTAASPLAGWPAGWTSVTPSAWRSVRVRCRLNSPKVRYVRRAGKSGVDGCPEVNRRSAGPTSAESARTGRSC
jgi:D-xylose transport system ATP-binding protein